MQSSLKRWLHIIGGAFGLLGVIFVIIQLDSYSEQIDLARFNTTDWILIFLLASVYALASLLLVQSWRELLLYFGLNVEGRWALRTYGISQLAKYVPGNILHLAGRQALGMAAGFPGRALAKSVMWELILFASAGAYLGCLITFLEWTGFSFAGLVIAFSAISIGVIAALHCLLADTVGKAFARQFIFLIISSVIFTATLAVITPQSITLSVFLPLCAAYVIAWLAGLLTPGAPAGVGVRELILLFLLKGVFAESDLLLAVVLGRVVTVLGDFIFFLLAYMTPQLRTLPASEGK